MARARQSHRARLDDGKLGEALFEGLGMGPSIA
jgi:hypothetical protein